MEKETQFMKQLSELLNKNSKENGSNTPDFILSAYMTGCLNNFNVCVNAREKWYGRKIEMKTSDQLEK